MFNGEGFREFLGPATEEKLHVWGSSWRFAIDESRFRNFLPTLRSTIHRHHSSFDYSAELSALGFPKTANEILRLRRGSPDEDHHATQMGNFAEVLGMEFAIHVMGFEQVEVFPKRFNPNPQQSMKGVDIIAVEVSKSPPRLLLGESKARQTFNADLIRNQSDGAIRHLRDLARICQNNNLAQLLYHWREILRIQQSPLKIDKVLDPSRLVEMLVFLVTENNPRSPFDSIHDELQQNRLPCQLTAVHVRVEKLHEMLPEAFEPTTQ